VCIVVECRRPDISPPHTGFHPPPPKTAIADVCLLVRVRFKVIRLVFRVTVRVTLVLGLGLLKLLLQLGVGLGLVVKVSVWVKIILKAELV